MKPYCISLSAPATYIAATHNGLIYVLLSTLKNDSRTYNLICFDEYNKLIWQKQLSTLNCKLRVTESGQVWVASNSMLEQYEFDGSVRQTIPLVWNENEMLANFLVLPDGFIVSSQSVNKFQCIRPRILRYDREARLCWEAILPIPNLHYKGLVRMGVETQWKLQPIPPKYPKNWSCNFVQEPLILSGERLLVSYDDISSGLGISYCLNANNGVLLWSTNPSPMGTRAITNTGQFLIGTQGYGAFETNLYDLDGEIVQRWNSQGYPLIAEDGTIYQVEMDNSVYSPQWYTILLPDGNIIKGPRLEGYYTTYPVITQDKRVAFWRNGELILIDQNLNKQILFSDLTLQKQNLMSRMLLTDHGKLIFTLNDDLWIANANLPPLANSSWHCGNGNLGGNPTYT